MLRRVLVVVLAMALIAGGAAAPASAELRVVEITYSVAGRGAATPVEVNDDRWRWGSKYWPGSVERYRHMVVNHEVGHWLGFRHTSCPAPGALAPIAQQQSKGLAGCTANPWPTPQERQRLAAGRGVAVLPLPGRVTVPTPSGLGSWTVAPDGGVFTAGDAAFHGSASDTGAVFAGIFASGAGYVLVAVDGRLFRYGI